MKAPKNLSYVDVRKHWRKLRPIFRSEEIQRLIIEHMIRKQVVSYMEFDQRFLYLPFDWEPNPMDWRPKHFDSCDWRCNIRGRHPAYFDYVCHGACHWLSHVNLEVAKRWDPKTPWVRLSGEKHSTVFDGKNTFFDPSYLALGVTPKECWEILQKGKPV